MYAKLKALMVEHQMRQKDITPLIPMAPSQFSRKLNRVDGLDFTISQGKSIQKIFRDRGTDLTLDEIFQERDGGEPLGR